MEAGITIKMHARSTLEYCYEGPDISADYRDAIRDGIFSALLSQVSAVTLVEVTVLDAREHSINSSYAAFFMAAKEATQELIEGQKQK